MKRLMTEKHQLMAYVLNKIFHYTMSDIANLMKVSQSTISNAIRDVEYRRTIQDLQDELDRTQNELIRRGIPLPTGPQLYLD